MFRKPAQARAFTLSFLLLTASAGSGCDTVRSKVRPYVCEDVAAGSGGRLGAAGAAGSAHAAAGSEAPVHESAHEAEPPPALGVQPADDTPHLTAAAKFALPFAWEKSPTEPLSRARTFLRELADDNAQHMAKHAAALKSYALGESPRTTVLSCADSRVQPSAFDATPENDDYTVRNLGNQLDVSLGAVQYGVERLSTPVLLILGHTGCDAIRAAVSDTKLEPAIQRELSGIKVKKAKGKLDEKHVSLAVLDNVHDQVKAALKRFSPRVTSNDLTIVGAVYDLRNDLGKGAGKLSIINVNGNRDEPRLKAFMDAIMASPNPNGKPAAKARENPLDRLARALSDSANLSNQTEEDEEEEEEAAPEPPSNPVAPQPTAIPANKAQGKH
jgi:carbonic anhydrase